MVAVVPKKTVFPLCTALEPQFVMVLAVKAAAPPMSFPGVIFEGAPRNITGLLTLLMALPYTLLDPPEVLVISAPVAGVVALCLILL